jgi:hypothetical protein
MNFSTEDEESAFSRASMRKIQSGYWNFRGIGSEGKKTTPLV